MPGKPLVVFRADGQARMGLGHLVRSSALAEMLAPEFHCVLVYRDCPASLLPALRKGFRNIKSFGEADPLFVSNPEPGSPAEAAALLRLLPELLRAEADAATDDLPIIVLDGYHFKTDYQRAIRAHGLKLACIDDVYACHYAADVIINHAGGVSPDDYSADAGAIYLLGLRYALLREPFRSARQPSVAGTDGERIFVCLGGADPCNDTINVLRHAVAQRPDAAFDLVLGNAYRHEAELNAFLSDSPIDLTIHRSLSAAAMKDLMARSTIGITSASTIAYEYLSAGGDLFLVEIVDNQKNIMAFFQSSGLTKSFFAQFPHFSNAEREAANELKATYFDGRAAVRYRTVFNQLR